MRLLFIIVGFLFVSKLQALEQSENCLELLKRDNNELYKIFAYFESIRSAKTIQSFNEFINKISGKHDSSLRSIYIDLLKESFNSGFICAHNFWDEPLHPMTRKKLKKALIDGSLRIAIDKHQSMRAKIKQFSEGEHSNHYGIHSFVEQLDVKFASKNMVEDMIISVVNRAKNKITLNDFIDATMYKTRESAPYYFILSDRNKFAQVREKLEKISGADSQRMLDNGLKDDHARRLVFAYLKQNSRAVADASFLIHSLVTISGIEESNLPNAFRNVKLSDEDVVTILRIIGDRVVDKSFSRKYGDIPYPFYEILLLHTLRQVQSLENLLALKKEWTALVKHFGWQGQEHPVIVRMIELGGDFNTVLPLWLDVHPLGHTDGLLFFKTSIIPLIVNQIQLQKSFKLLESSISINQRFSLFLDCNMFARIVSNKGDLDEVLSLIEIPKIQRPAVVDQVVALLKEKEKERKFMEQEKLLQLMQTNYKNENNFYDSFSGRTPQKTKKVVRECPICLDEFPANKLVQLPLHKHEEACRDCWMEQIKSQVEEGLTHIRCVGLSCGKQLTYKELLHLKEVYELVSREQMYLLKDRSYRSFLLKQKNWAPCRGLDCGLGKFVTDNDYYLDCDCGFHGCLKCGHSHRGQDCNKYIEEENMVRSTWKLNGIAPCPVCKTKIQKNEGCTSVKCTTCQSSFDWETLKLSNRHRTAKRKFERTIETEIDKPLAPVAEEQLERWSRQAESNR